MGVRLQLFTVPGQVYYNATRKLVLTGADGVVLVFDSQRARGSTPTSRAWRTCATTCARTDARSRELPHVVQYNKRDLSTSRRSTSSSASSIASAARVCHRCDPRRGRVRGARSHHARGARRLRSAHARDARGARSSSSSCPRAGWPRRCGAPRACRRHRARRWFRRQSPLPFDPRAARCASRRCRMPIRARTLRARSRRRGTPRHRPPHGSWRSWPGTPRSSRQPAEGGGPGKNGRQSLRPGTEKHGRKRRPPPTQAAKAAAELLSVEPAPLLRAPGPSELEPRVAPLHPTEPCHRFRRASWSRNEPTPAARNDARSGPRAAAARPSPR